MKRASDQTPNTPQKYGHARRIIPIRHRIWLRVALRWLILLAVGGVMALLCYISAPRFRSPRDLQISIGMTILLYLFIIRQCRLIKLTFSKEWMGRIVGREVVKYTKFNKGPVARQAVMATKCIWTVETEDGYIEKIHCDTDEIWERYFEIGEPVRFYKNAKIPVKAYPQRDDENLMCPLCGVMVMEPICRRCGIHFAEVPPQKAQGKNRID